MKETGTPKHPGASYSITGGYAALKDGAAIVDHSDRALLRLSGKDPRGMLNAILSNDVPADESRGVYAMLLNPKGRILSGLRVLKSNEEVLIEAEAGGAASAKETLGRYAPFSRVKVEDLSDSWSVMGLYGPGAETLLNCPALAEHETAEIEVEGATLLAAGVLTPAPGYDLIGPSEVVAAARDRLVARGATPADHSAYETVRIETGVPRYGADITPDNFPGETGLLERAVNFHKGCYPGQETVARMHYRGHPNKTLYRLAIEGHPPELGENIIQAGKVVGVITSVAPLPVEDRILALGYLSRTADIKEPLQAGEAGISPLGPVGS